VHCKGSSECRVEDLQLRRDSLSGHGQVCNCIKDAMDKQNTSSEKVRCSAVGVLFVRWEIKSMVIV